jgi:hypothetical protein
MVAVATEECESCDSSILDSENKRENKIDSIKPLDFVHMSYTNSIIHAS